MFYTVESVINTYKTTGTQFAEALFTNKKVSAPMVALIEAQANFANQVTDSATKLFDYVAEEAMSYANKNKSTKK